MRKSFPECARRATYRDSRGDMRGSKVTRRGPPVRRGEQTKRRFFAASSNCASHHVRECRLEFLCQAWMTVSACSQDSLFVSLFGIIHLARSFKRLGQFAICRTLIVRLTQVKAKFGDSFLPAFKFQKFIREPESYWRVLRLRLKHLSEKRNSRFGHGFLPAPRRS